MSRPDPRSPLVVSTRELGRRPGSQRWVDIEAEAPADLGTPMARVPEGSAVRARLSLESVLDGVYVHGTAEFDVRAECSRCLEPIRWHDSLLVEELFVDVVDPEDDDPPPLIVDELLDLEPVLRDAVVLSLPIQPVCSDSCPGLCPQCGILLSEQPGHSHDEVDPRWSALRALVAETPPGEPGSEPARKD